MLYVAHRNSIGYILCRLLFHAQGEDDSCRKFWQLFQNQAFGHYRQLIKYGMRAHPQIQILLMPSPFAWLIVPMSF